MSNVAVANSSGTTLVGPTGTVLIVTTTNTAITGTTLISGPTGASSATPAAVTTGTGRFGDDLLGAPLNVGNAIFGYIQAVRSLDRTRITTSEIASALSIPEAAVISALPSLRVKGVKIAR